MGLQGVGLQPVEVGRTIMGGAAGVGLHPVGLQCAIMGGAAGGGAAACVRKGG